MSNHEVFSQEPCGMPAACDGNASETTVFCLGSLAELQSALAVDRHITTRYFKTLATCLARLQTDHCDLLVVDLDESRTEGLRLLQEARKRFMLVPRLALVNHGDIDMAVKAMKGGATDCLEKPIDADRLRSTVQSLIHSGGSFEETEIPLTRMERRVLGGILEGYSTRDIANRFHRSPRTIEVHRRNVMSKMRASNIVDLVRQGYQMGLLDRPIDV